MKAPSEQSSAEPSWAPANEGVVKDDDAVSPVVLVVAIAVILAAVILSVFH